MKIRVGSRKSLLAMTQTEMALEYMKRLVPELEWEIVGLISKGDQDQKTSLRQLGGEGIFVRRLEEALINKEIDIAIHSAKDVPTILAKECVLAGVLKRANPKDLLILKKEYENYTSLKSLPIGLKIGTGSLRRQAQLSNYLPDVSWKDIRGNIDTRLKMIDQDLDGIILAKAGVERLGIERLNDYHYIEIDTSQCLPAPGQGFLAIETLKDNFKMIDLLNQVSDMNGKRQLECERAFLRTLGLSCSYPLGVYVTGEEELHAKAYLAKDADSQGMTMTLKGNDPVELGSVLAKSLSEKMGL